MAPMFDRKIFTLKIFKVDLWPFWSQWSSWSCCVYNVWLWLSITLQLCCDALFDLKCNHFRCLHPPVKCACNHCKWMLNGYPNGTATLHGSATRPTRLSHLCQGHMCYTVREGLMYPSDPRSGCDCVCVCVKVSMSLCVCACGVHVCNIRNHPGENGLKPSQGHQRNADGLEVESAAEYWLPCTPSLVANGWKQQFWEEPRRPYRKASSLAFAAPASFGRVWGPGKDLRSRPNQ